MNGGRIDGAFMGLARADGNELGGGEWFGDVRDEECGERTSEREEWLEAMSQCGQSTCEW